MKRQIIAAITSVMLVLTGALLGPVEIHAQALADYTSTPPFISNAVPPNVLLLLDNSGSMNERAYQSAFDPTKTYLGLFDPLECYDYASNKFIPDPAANPAVLGTCTNSPSLWTGNLLNYASMRRIDIAKWVMMGGTCSVGGRDAQGNCRQLIGQSTFGSSCCLDQTQSVPVALAAGRMPASLILPSGSMFFHLVGNYPKLYGAFCVDDDPIPDAKVDCFGPDPYVETMWQIRVDLLENVSGVITQVSDRIAVGVIAPKKPVTRSASRFPGRLSSCFAWRSKTFSPSARLDR